MGVKEYEQNLIQRLAREHEDIIKKAENPEKYSSQLNRGRERTLLKIIEKFMGFKYDNIRVGKEVYRFRYFKNEKVRHTRNMFKRR